MRDKMNDFRVLLGPLPVEVPVHLRQPDRPKEFLDLLGFDRSTDVQMFVHRTSFISRKGAKVAKDFKQGKG